MFLLSDTSQCQSVGDPQQSSSKSKALCLRNLWPQLFPDLSPVAAHALPSRWFPRFITSSLQHTFTLQSFHYLWIKFNSFILIHYPAYPKFPTCFKVSNPSPVPMKAVRLVTQFDQTWRTIFGKFTPGKDLLNVPFAINVSLLDLCITSTDWYIPMTGGTDVM